VAFCNSLIVYDEEFLAPRLASELEDHPLSAVRDCLFNIFAAGGRLLHPQPEDAPGRGHKGATNMEDTCTYIYNVNT
jgi:hypothetical protein